jgi:hypothetical protein
LTDFVLGSERPDGTVKSVKLTAEIWQGTLLRGTQRETLSALWNRRTEVMNSRNEFRDFIEKDPKMVQGVIELVRDLRQYEADSGAEHRLQGQGNVFYLGPPYFSPQQVQKILAIKTMKGDLRDVLTKIFDGQYVVGSTTCSGHVLAPLYEAAFGVRWDKGARKPVWASLPQLK